MGYLLTEIVVYLVIAGLIGFVFGWLVRDGALDKYFNKFVEFINKTWIGIKGLLGKLTSSKEKEDVVNTNDVIAEDVKKIEETKNVEAVVTATEVITEDVKTTIEEVKTVEPITAELKEVVEEKVVEVTTPTGIVEMNEDVVKPTLLTKVPEKGADKLSTIKGIGPVLEKKLNELGIYSFEQIASWNVDQEVWIGTQMAFPKRVTKEEWVKQAKELLKNK